MHTTSWPRGLAALPLLFLAPSAVAEPSAACCFNNPRYSGICQVAPAADETCASVLDYLNNAAAVGKGYCGGTNVRGGWQQVACQPASRGPEASEAGTDDLARVLASR